MGRWRKLNNLYSSPYIIISDQIKEDDTGRACSIHRRWEKHIQFQSVNIKEKIHGRHMQRWEKNIKMDLTEETG